MLGGYVGKYLWVDLTSGEMRAEMPAEEILREYIGGYGLGARILYERMRPGVDPLGPENILGCLTGPLTGSPCIEGNRSVFVCKSPLTGTWGDANCGGTFGAHLKFAGLDGVYFTGIAAKPIYLFVENGQAELRDASDLWGKDTNEAEDILRERHGKGTQVAGIGPAGEMQSLIACIINDYGRAWGRSGVGAVMGSKRLKAIVVRGDTKIPMADPERARDLRREYIKRHTGDYELFTKYGTPGILAESAISGDSPVKNWGGAGAVDLPSALDKFEDDYIIKTYQDRKYGCWQCTMACGGHMSVKHEGPWQGVRHHKAEYETACMFGTNCLNDNYASTIKANEICNKYGLDTISAAATIAFAIECYENGLISKADTDGIELTWGNDVSIIAMLEKMARREGFGAVLADGAKRAAERIGKGSEQYAIHIQGQEIPAHDPKYQPGLATTYLMDATPGRHTQGHEQFVFPDIGFSDEDKYTYLGKAELHRKSAAFMHVINAAGVCQFASTSYPAQFIPDFLSAVVGVDYTFDDIFTIGERIANIRHAFNIREGLNPLEWHVPGRIVGDPPLQAGNVRGITLPWRDMVREYCEVMGWDIKTARPSRERLERLNMSFVADSLGV